MLTFARFMAASLVVLASQSAIASDNLVVNPSFDDVDQLSGWIVNANRIAQWDSADEQGLENSGSARLTHDIDGNNGVLSIMRQCVPVQPNKAYVFGGSILLPAGQADEAGNGRVVARTYATSDCTGEFDSNFTPLLDEVGQWQLAEALVVTESDTGSIRMNLSVQKFSGFTEDLDVLFDNIFLHLEDQVFRDSFESML
jgi:hypothetical protein